MRESPRNRRGRSAGRTTRAIALGAVAVVGLTRDAARAQPCNDWVCLELSVPPHVAELRRGSSLECLLVLPAPAQGPVPVRIVLRAQPQGCVCQYETLQPGTTWKLATIALPPDMPPGIYRIGVARPSADEQTNGACVCAPGVDDAKYLVRQLAVVP